MRRPNDRSARHAAATVRRALTLGLTLEEIAVRLEVSESNLRIWLSGRTRKVNSATARRLDALDAQLAASSPPRPSEARVP